MSKRMRKTRRQKIRAEERRLTDINTLRRQLINQKINLEAQIKQDRKRKNVAMHIRNLRIFKDTCNFLLPFVICAGISIGGGWLFGAGLPVKQDEIHKPKFKSLAIEAQGEYKDYKEEYISVSIFDDTKDSSLTIYTPWEKQEDGMYTRVKRKYGKAAKAQQVMEALLRDDFDYILENVDGYAEEIQQVNQIFEEPAYKVEAHIYILDRSDYLTYPESDSRNTWVTIIEALIALGLGGLIAYKRDFSYNRSLKWNQKEYLLKYAVWKKDVEKLKETEEKILSLKKGGR